MSLTFSTSSPSSWAHSAPPPPPPPVAVQKQKHQKQEEEDKEDVLMTQARFDGKFLWFFWFCDGVSHPQRQLCSQAIKVDSPLIVLDSSESGESTIKANPP